MKFMKHISNFLLIVIFLSTCTGSSFEEQKIINCEGNVTVFYPPNYNAKSHTPSFSIINEPTVIFDATDSSTINLEFSKFMDRQIAQI